MLALALVMTCTFTFAASQSPYSKGKYFGKQTVTVGVEGDEDDLENLVERIEDYVGDYVETEEHLYSFLKGFEAGVYEACDEYGLGAEVADELMTAFAAGMLEELM